VLGTGHLLSLMERRNCLSIVEFQALSIKERAALQ
jgi:hypothetical protein